jgi:ABC-2 type transport system ATP-binding protein
MLRRLGIAQALLGPPSALLLDEPTVGLDPMQRRDLRQLIRELAETQPVVVSTHLSEDVAAIATSVLVLDGGRLCFKGSVEELVASAGADEVRAETVEAGFMGVVGRLGA